VKLRSLFIVFLSLFVGVSLGVMTRQALFTRRFNMSSLGSEAWKEFPPERQKFLSTARKRFLAMNTEKRRLVQDRWRYYRHLPAWRQAELLKEFEQWKMTHSDQLYAS
jgi:hypothetical protein